MHSDIVLIEASKIHNQSIDKASYLVELQLLEDSC